MTPTEPPPVAGSNAGRGLSRGAGALFQLIGAVLALGSCCWWSFSGWTQTKLDDPASIHSLGDVARVGGAAALFAMGSVVVSFIGGLGLAAVGMGLSTQRRGSGPAACLVTIVGLLFWVADAVWIVRVGPRVGPLILAGAMGLVWGFCLILAFVSADELRRMPPPSPDVPTAADLDAPRLRQRELPPDLRDDDMGVKY